MFDFYFVVEVLFVFSGEMSGWAGFSDDELRRLQQREPVVARGRRPAAGRSRQQLQRERALQLFVQRANGASEELKKLPPTAGLQSTNPAGVPEQQRLNRPPPRTEPQPGAPAGVLEKQQLSRPPASTEPQPGALAGTPAGIPAVREELHKPSAEEQVPAVKELEQQEVELREKTHLEQLQQEQKMMEEMNKQKKALLAKTIAEKSKQTQAEAVKLKRIQRELQALDNMVSNDIGILRGKIEQASWDYSAARKRYEKAEAEYVAAKLDLHKKTELKEQLMEHLYAVIQQNELRKACKLEELMQQLQLHPNKEEAEQQKRGCEETPPSGKEENGLPKNQEGNLHSSDVGETAVEECVELERGGSIQEDHQTTTESPKTEDTLCGTDSPSPSQTVAS
ncbi:RAB6-interacting golgin [Thalassophryne amazonica]|uniref:RAB6-interacting golgin n=1 Tax=Thalassophryne amazonica TaxID=390379 RepID=UPI001470A2BD|nr:RAB6-interacting golgin [Thalassophryne amazonica]